MPAAEFAKRIVRWQRAHGRNDLPWQGTRDPYKIWVSEIMLQQTQVAAVVGYYQRFMARFPTVRSLAEAPLDAVMQHWAGLGYYARARNLHRAAARIHAHGWPQTPEAMADLPGIGPSTAAAICAFAYGTQAAILDGNVKRVLARHAGVEGFPGSAPVEAKLWAIARERLAKTDIEAYTQGLMDLGATVCTRAAPQCNRCPVAKDCVAFATDQTARLPTPRPRKALLEREVWIWLYEYQGLWHLAKRPLKGIWGGLWSLPESASADAAPLPLHGAKPAPLPAFEHTFTHFKLRLHPLHVHCTRAPAGALWHTPMEARALALAAPIARFLAEF